jgi:flagellar hook-length control protein FliK
MPSTTPTSVVIAPILDLLGPGSQSAAQAKGQPGFDELLRPPPRIGPATPKPDDQGPHASPSATISTNDSADPAQHQAPADTALDETNQIESESDDDGPPQQDAEQSTSEGASLVDSLAGLPAALSVSAADAVAVPEDSGESADSYAGETELAAAKPKSALSARSAISAAEINQDTGNSAAIESVPAEFSVDPNPDASQPGQLASIDAESAIVETQVVSSDPSTGESSGLNGRDTDSAIDGGTPSHGQDEESSAHHEAAPIDLVSETEVFPVAAPTAAESANQATFGPPESQTASSSSNPSAAAATSAISSASPLQARLPGDVLVQPSGPLNRRSAIEIDSARLLTRVARAFAAAQERDGEIRLRLSPPELGSLRLDVRVQDGALVAHLQTETDAARSAIIENLSALRERLSDQGVRIERFEVDLMQRQPGGMPDHPGWQESDAPARPLQVAPVSRPRSGSPASNQPSPGVGSAGGLNVIV